MKIVENLVRYTSFFNGPILDKIKISFTDSIDSNHYPFSLPIVRNLREIIFPTQVTFFVGENGTGKSTILEAIAHKAGFGAEGGNKNITFKTSQEKNYKGSELLAEYFILSWRQKPKSGYFFRAESFFNVANYLDSMAREWGPIVFDSYGGISLHEQSHGESFLSFFKSRAKLGGFFIFDEPEAALSPQRQLALMSIIHDMCKNPQTQFIIASHSPLLLAYPHATIYSCDSDMLTNIAYKDTEHYQITKHFIDNPDLYMRHLFSEG